MTPTEYRERREQMGLTQAQLARHMDIDVMTVSRRERDESRIDREAELAMLWLWESLRGTPPAG